MMRTRICGTLLFLAGCTVGQAAKLSPAEQTAAVNAVREYALSYPKRLPNDMCTLATSHTTRPANAINDPSIERTVTEEQLSFVDGKPTGDPQAGMVQRQVEGLLDVIFEPATAADLRWNRAATLNGHQVDVLAFHIPQTGGYFLTGHRGVVRVPFEGLVFADAQTHAVLRIQMKCTMIPESSIIRNFDLTLDYNAAQLAGREVILPSHFVMNYVDVAADRQVLDDGRYSAWRQSDGNKQ